MAKKEEEVFKISQRNLEEKLKAEEERRSRIRDQQRSAAANSINEISIFKKEQQSIQDMERQIYFDKMKKQENMEKQKKLEYKEKLRNEQANYSKILQYQHKSKLDKINEEKLADKIYSEAQRMKLEKEDDQRAKFFDKLSKIQEKNDIKQKKLQEYMEQDPKEIRSRADEVSYLKNIEAAEKNGKLKDITVKAKKEKSQVSNYQSLALQLQEKNFKNENVKIQENAIANYYNNEADKYKQELENEKLKKKKQKEEYFKALSTQINENKKKQQYSVLMTEHERRVNDKDIKAYEQQDTANLYSKVVGFGGDKKLEKYIDKAIIVNKNMNSPNKSSSKENDLFDNKNGSNSNLARMGQMSLNRSSNILTDAEDPPRIFEGESYSHPRLQRVKENMEKEDAFKYRANTLNRAYGFSQNLNKAPPNEKMLSIDNEANPYEYNFVAPGNY